MSMFKIKQMNYFENLLVLKETRSKFEVCIDLLDNETKVQTYK